MEVSNEWITFQLSLYSQQTQFETDNVGLHKFALSRRETFILEIIIATYNDSESEQT